jgi:hypothetical protein
MEDPPTGKSKWGPMFWQLGHLVSFAYAEQNPTSQQREQTARFYESLSSVLPCDECKVDYAGILASDPVRPHLNSRDDLSRWFYNVHNKVNAKLGKAITLTYDQVKDRYLTCQSQTQEVQTCKKNLGGQRIWIIVLAAALISLLAYLFVTKNKK